MKYLVLVMLLSASPVLAETKPVKPIVEPGWIYCMGPETGKSRMCRMFWMDGPPPRLAENFSPIPNTMSVMRLGAITPEDLGNVTASDLAKTPAQPLPVGESIMELLQ